MSVFEYFRVMLPNGLPIAADSRSSPDGRSLPVPTARTGNVATGPLSPSPASRKQSRMEHRSQRVKRGAENRTAASGVRMAVREGAPSATITIRSFNGTVLAMGATTDEYGLGSLPSPSCRGCFVLSTSPHFVLDLAAAWQFDDLSPTTLNHQAVRRRFAQDVFQQHFIGSKGCLHARKGQRPMGLSKPRRNGARFR